jgi:DNA-binding transcriptional LysR family regulator
MDFAQMDWGDLKFFAELARGGSLSATARRLKVDHSTVARRVAALEGALGVRLFDRLPRGYALTAEGERVAELTGRLEDDIFAILRLTRGQQGALTGTVRISAPPVFASHFIAARLGPLRAAHPGIVVELIGDSHPVSLTRRDADIALRLARPEDGALVARKLATMRYALYGARSYVAARPPAEWDYLGYDESLEHVPQQRWVLGLAGERKLALRANDLSSLHNAVKAGLGVAALPMFLAGQDRTLVRLPPDGRTADREIWLLVHDDLRRSARVRAVMDHLIEMIEKGRRALEGA